jgi:aminomethyltransferase
MFSDVEEELRAIRTSVAMIDMSPLPKAEVSGPDATKLVDLLITRRVSKMGVGHAIYTPICAESGHVVTDGLVLRIAEDRYRLSGDSVFEWCRQHAGGFAVTVADITNQVGILSLQGPNAVAVLTIATGESWEDFKFSRIRRAAIGGAEVDIARQGFTGELGFEIWVDRDDAPAVWQAMNAAGEEFGIVPAGEYAADIARVEAGIILIRADYTGAGPSLPFAHGALDPANKVTPKALGLDRLVDFSKPDFIGKAALEAQLQHDAQAEGFTGLLFDASEIFELYLETNSSPNLCPRVRWRPMRLLHNGKAVGRATSVTWSPTVGALIGFGCLGSDLIEEGRSDLKVEWRDEAGRVLGLVSTKQVPTPFTALRRSA